ncbi:MAG: recombination protein RecR [Deltaproteobacteria bacterium]|nr:recombination protein RecR [Deltaproteobacteria bacterium]
MQYAEPILRLIKALSTLPGIGEKTASRMTLFILNAKGGYAEELISSIKDVRDRVRRCSVCMGFSEKDPCRICADASRDAAVVCVVCDYRDMIALEAAGTYRGRYHILHGLLSPLKGIGPDDIRLGELVGRIRSDGAIKEIILATAFDAEGEATAHYLKKALNRFDLRLTRIASGVPVGGHIEYMDPSTLGRAMEGRREI